MGGGVVVGGGLVAAGAGLVGVVGAGLAAGGGFFGFRHFPAAAFRLLQAPLLALAGCARFLAVAGP